MPSIVAWRGGPHGRSGLAEVLDQHQSALPLGSFRVEDPLLVGRDGQRVCHAEPIWRNSSFLRPDAEVQKLNRVLVPAASWPNRRVVQAAPGDSRSYQWEAGARTTWFLSPRGISVGESGSCQWASFVDRRSGAGGGGIFQLWARFEQSRYGLEGPE